MQNAKHDNISFFLGLGGEVKGDKGNYILRRWGVK